MGIKDSFDSQIRYHVGTGEDIFWRDVWVGDTPLVVQFPDLYSCARNKQAKAVDYMNRVADRVLWGPTLGRDLTESVEENLMTLLDKLDQISILVVGNDKRVWVA